MGDVLFDIENDKLFVMCGACWFWKFKMPATGKCSYCSAPAKHLQNAFTSAEAAPTERKRSISAQHELIENSF